MWHNFCHFGPFFALLPQYWPPKLKFGKNVRNTWRYYPFPYVYHKRKSYHMKYGSWDIRHNRVFCHFLPFDPTNNLKNLNFEKMKKTPGDIIILHKHTINYNHMMYGSRDMKHDRQNFLLFWAIFHPFTQLTTQKIKILKKWKKAWRYQHFRHVCQKLWSENVQFLRYGAQWTDWQTDGQTDERTERDWKSGIQRWMSHLTTNTKNSLKRTTHIQ